MGIPFFQQQSAAYNIHQKQNLHIFTPDGRRYQVNADDKSYAAYADEVREHLIPFEVEAMLAQRDSLRTALTRRYLTQHFGVGGDALFAGMELDDVSAELKQRGIAAAAIKSALRNATTRAAGETKDTWPIRETGHSLQYTSYDLVFAEEEAGTPAKRQKIWDAIAAWARASKLPGKEGARLAGVQDWDEAGDGHAVRVDLHHYPRPDLDSCRAITLLDAGERNKDLDILRKALARIGVELAEFAAKPYTAHHSAPPRAAAPEIDRTEPQMPPSTPNPPPAQAKPSLNDTLAAVRFERDRLDQQLRFLSDALVDHEERQRLMQRIESLEQEKAGMETLLRGIANTLDNLVWPNKPSNWAHFPPIEKGRYVVEALGHTLTTLSQSEKSLQIAKSEVHTLTAELRETRQSRDQWQNRAESVEKAIREELLKQHDAALLAQEIDFTRQIQAIQQERRRENQQLQDDHLRQLEELQESHLKQIQKLRRLVPTQNILHVELESLETPASAIAPSSAPAASGLARYQAESQEIFDTRIGEYLRIAKDKSLGDADEWLLAEAKKLAEVRAKQGVLGL